MVPPVGARLLPRSGGSPFLSLLLLLLLLLLCSGGGCLPRRRPAGPPVVLVPGDLGNQLEAKLDKPSVVHYLCSKKTDSYFTLWLNLELLLPVIIDCWIDNIRLVYNRTSKITEPPDGVDIRVPGFGQTFSLEFLDPSKRSVGSYFYMLVQSLVDWGYKRDEDVRGAPYDWRKAPSDNNRIPVISSLKIRDQQRSAVSTNWMLPYNYTWPPDKVFVSTPTANYTVCDYQKFYRDINFEDGWLMRQDTEPLVYQMTPPGVRLHCLYGTGVETPDSFHYESFPDKEPKILYSDGDGTVNLQSALQCQKWVDMQKQEVVIFELSGNEHIQMLSNDTTISYVKKLLFDL
ncbi:lysosomal phospholipase A and acyltransferase isoform X2 [Mycteria americana]|uniref:lysosomal phospholipase A and acyltransferase isoform X2 n=1 Tax=Mycteria americana TaxID=33587 RepID=UPI003F58BC6A